MGVAAWKRQSTAWLIWYSSVGREPERRLESMWNEEVSFVSRPSWEGTVPERRLASR